MNAMPSEMPAQKQRLRAAVGLPLLAVALLAVLPLGISNPYILHLLILFLMWVGLGQAWNIVGGFAGQHSFGHAAFFGIGAYTISLLYDKFDFPLILGGILGGLLAAVISLPIGTVTFRLRGPYFALTMLGIAEIFRLIAINWRSLTKGPVGILFPPVFSNKVPFYYAVLFLAAAVMIVGALILRSRLGYYLRAIRDDEDAANAIGIDPVRFKLAALMISAFLTGVLGAFFAPYQGYIDPDIVFSGTDVSIAMVVVAILGGIGTLWGPAVGALVTVLVSEVFRSSIGEGHVLLYAALIIFIILFLPEGVVGWLQNRLAGSSHARLAASGLQPAAAAEEAEVTYGRREAGALGQPLLRLQGVTKQFGGLTALRDVTFDVRKGEFLGLIGPNGAGKTTLLANISGFLAPTSGTIVFQDRDITGRPPYELLKLGVARTFQVVRPLGHMTVLENVLTAALSKTDGVAAARARADEVLEFVGLAHRRDFLAGNLTLGERKRLELARALATDPALLLLDEVAAGLNPAERQAIIRVLGRIRDRGITIIAVEHVLEVVMTLADRIVVLHYGQVLAEGTPEEVTRNPDVIDAYLGRQEEDQSA